MWSIANKDHQTLKITKGKKYDIYFYSDKYLVSVENDIGDEIVITSSIFDKVE